MFHAETRREENWKNNILPLLKPEESAMEFTTTHENIFKTMSAHAHVQGVAHKMVFDGYKILPYATMGFELKLPNAE